MPLYRDQLYNSTLIFVMTISQCIVDAMVCGDLFNMLIYVDITLIQQGLVHGEIFSQRDRPSRKFLAHEQTAYSTAETRSTDDGIYFNIVIKYIFCLMMSILKIFCLYGQDFILITAIYIPKHS